MIIDGLKQGFIRNAEKGIPGGVASLDENGQLSAETVPPITASDVGAIALSEIGVSIAQLVNGVIPAAQLPPVAITDVFVVNTEAAMLALTAQPGDVAVRTDVLKTFILKGVNSSVLSSWQELPTPIDTILSINGKTGVVVLSAADVGAIALSEKGALNGVATLSGGIVPFTQLPAIAPLTSILIVSVPTGSAATIGQWINMPAAATELYGNANNRIPIDLSNFTQVRLIVNVLVLGTATATLGGECSLNNGATWTDFVTAGFTVNIGTVGLKASAWATIPLTNRASALLRIMGAGGNSAADPQFNRIELQFR